MKIVMLKFAIEVWLSNKMNEKRSSDYKVEECGGPTKMVHTVPIQVNLHVSNSHFILKAKLQNLQNQYLHVS